MPTKTQPPAIEIQGLTRLFRRVGLIHRFWGRGGPSDVVALEDVDLVVERGELFGLVGCNGYGKTTLVKSIAGLLEPTRGTIRIDGHDVVAEALAVKGLVGLVTSEDRSFYWRLSGWQNLLFFARLNGLNASEARRRIDPWIALFNLEQFMARPVHTYSLGSRQRLALTRALMTDPRILLLDEPTRSLDPIMAEGFRRTIRDRLRADGRRTVIITSNNVADIESSCDRVGILRRGRLVACSTMEDLSRRYAPREAVALRARQPIGCNGLETLQARVPSLNWEAARDGALTIRFTRRPDDPDLHWLLERLMADGYQILDCEVQRLGLREIMESVEQEG
jgi:ABC-2 type transport system ATP-binding protein